MSEEQKQKETNDAWTTWAYGILESHIEAFNRVAGTTNQTEKLNLTKQLNQEYIESLPKLCEAFLILSQPEHRQMIHQFFKAYAGVFESWRKKQ